MAHDFPAAHALNGDLKRLGLNKRQRAVSDFGMVGNNLPSLKSEDILMLLRRKESRISDSESDEDNTNTVHKGQYRPPPISSMYSFHASDEEDEKADKGQRGDAISLDKSSNAHSYKFDLPHENGGNHRNTTLSNTIEQRRIDGKNNTLDWTNELGDIESEDENQSLNVPDISIDVTEHYQIFTVCINRILGESFGFQISSSDKVIVNQITAEPAISSDLEVGDAILSINGILIDGCSHQKVVQMLKDAGEMLILEIKRFVPVLNPENDPEKSITLLIDKLRCEPIGLCFGKRIGYDGVFVRSIIPNSLADQEGTICVGDRICQINGSCVSKESPAGIGKILKDSEGKLAIELKRTIFSK